MSDLHSQNQWGCRERLDLILVSARRKGHLGWIEVDFEQIKEALTEIDRLTARVAELLKANMELAELLRSDGRHTLDCDLVKHPNCTRCTCTADETEASR